MKIMHASIPADDPKRTADVLATLMGGEAMPFPPGGSASWMVWSSDGATELEIVPRGHLMTRTPTQGDGQQGDWQQAEPAQRHSGRHSECHLAISVSRPAEEIIAIAQDAGWPARLCSRGGGYFDLVEVWVDGCFMLELLDPAQTAHYERVVTPARWKQFLAQQPPA